MIAGENSGQLDSIQMDFVARRFDTFSEVFTIEYYDDDQILQEVDLTGGYAQMQIKKRKSDASAILNMDVAISGNEITISKNHTLMDLPKGKYWFDLEVKDSDSAHITWVHGRFTVVEHVTQWIETFVATVWNKFESFLEMPDVPKTIFANFIHQILTVITIPIYSFRAIIKSVLEITTLKNIIRNYRGFFNIVLDIIRVPKIIFNVIFDCIVTFIAKIFFYGTARFATYVFFYNIGEEINPYKIQSQ